MNDERPTHIDLFSGIGGFALAARWAGFRTIAFCERDKYCQRVLKKHWPEVSIFGDITKLCRRTFDCERREDDEVWCPRCDADFGGCECIGADEFTDRFPPPYHLLTGGFPCQPFSVAGKQRGKEDDRYLWPEMLRVISETNPSWVIGENVTELDGLGLDRCIDGLESLGYEVAPPLEIPAFAAGAYHQRFRIWLIAHYPSVPVEKSEMVLPAWSIPEFRESSIGFPPCLWEPHRETYLAEMAGDVHGVSSWVDRSKGLGNAIVPQVAYPIMREIRNLIEAETSHF